MNQIELCNPSSEGVPRRVFDALYQSFWQLNAKLASKCSHSVPRFDHEDASGPRPPASGSLDLISFEDGFRDSLERTEDQGLGVAAADRCCTCLTAASNEELMMTPCCLRAVGSFCFKEGLQEVGKCCLCQMHPYKSNLPLDGTSDYKVRSIPATDREETTYKAPVGIFTTWCAEKSNSFPKSHAVAADPPPLIDFSDSLIANTTDNQEKQNLIQFPNTEKVEGELLARLCKSPSLAQNPATQQWCKPAKGFQYKLLDTINQGSFTIPLPKHSDISTTLEEQKNQTGEQVCHSKITFHKLRLHDQYVICHLEGMDEENLLDLVYSAFKERLHRTACKGFFRRARVLKGHYLNLSICLTCSRDTDLMFGLGDGSSVFQSFVLATQLRRYQVTVYHIQIRTMNIARDSDKSETVRKLFNNNSSILKSFRKPGDIRKIQWSESVFDLQPRDYASITVTFSTAQQANEAIQHGVLWNDERCECKRLVPRLRITQCRRCQAYGHLFKECSSAPRCCHCAGMHLTAACAHRNIGEYLKCALCGGPHSATHTSCNSREAERYRLQLKNRFYPTY